MRLAYLLIFIYIYFDHKILCYRSTQSNRRKMIEMHSRNNAKSRKDERFNDNYVYTADYSPSENRNDYEDDDDYGSLRDSREEKETGEDKAHYETDEEVSLALSMLTEHELDQLERLIDDDDQQEAGEMVMKREIDSYQKTKRECNDDSCIQTERDGARAVRKSNSEKDQLASFRSWFSRNKTTKTTRRTTTTKKNLTRTTKTRSSLRPTQKSITKTNQTRQRQRLLSDNRNILRYNNKIAKGIIDENVREKINSLTSKIKRRVTAQKSDARSTMDNKKTSQNNARMNRLNYLIRRKRNSIVTGTRGTLDDSFPHPKHETASFHATMEPLVRVKRGPSAV